MEYLDLLDEYGQPTGKTKERTLVHRDGDLHRTAHVWIARRDPGTNSIQLLMQKRSDRKDSYPGCNDISSAGHVPAGEGFTESALRELKEELGISALPEQLRFLFYHKGYAQAEFYGKTFINNEYSAVYLYTGPVEASSLFLQEEEVSEVRWMDYETVLEQVMQRNGKFCIFVDELAEMDQYLSQYL